MKWLKALMLPLWDDRANTPYEEGYKAYPSKKTRYQPGTPEFEQWQRGWNEARQFNQTW